MEQTKEVSLLAKFDELAAEMGSANKAANRIGIPASTISMLKKGAYSGNKDAQFAKLAAYFDTKTEGAESYSEVDYAPTSISEKIYQTIKTCQIKGGVAIATGDSGIGKTKAVQKYHADNPLNSIVSIAMVLRWETPYARTLYYGVSKKGNPISYSHDENPKACKMWAHKAESVKGEQWRRQLQKLLTGSDK